MIDVFTIGDLLGPEVCDRVIAGMRLAGGAPATVYGKSEAGSVDPLTRKVTRVAVAAETAHSIERHLLDRKPEIENHFGVTLTEVEEPQFLHYRPGDYFVAHQDGNTPLVFDDTRFRKISIVAFLNEYSEDEKLDTYSGGSLVLHGAFPNYDYRQPVANGAGTLAAFRSETTHEVTPILRGERFTIVSWFR